MKNPEVDQNPFDARPRILPTVDYSANHRASN